MKNIKTLLLGNLIALSITVLQASPILADGGSSYSPYGPHVPVPTGFGNIESVALIGAISYIGGISLMTFSNIIKNRLAK